MDSRAGRYNMVAEGGSATCTSSSTTGKGKEKGSEGSVKVEVTLQVTPMTYSGREERSEEKKKGEEEGCSIQDSLKHTIQGMMYLLPRPFKNSKRCGAGLHSQKKRFHWKVKSFGLALPTLFRYVPP